MNTTIAVKAAPSLREIQPSFPPKEIISRVPLQELDRQWRASITGDLTLRVTEQEVARGPITGNYTVETQDMKEPLHVLWHAQDGEVFNRCASTTPIAFDLSGTQAGHMWTTVITVQVTDAETFSTIIEGTFVQILVT
jgi:hypothetical protein